MFRVYKPKNFIKVRALQVTKENANDVAGLLLGRVKFVENTDDSLPAGVDVPTLDGVKHFEVGSWILRSEDNTLTKMSEKEFEKTYEVARNMTGNSNT